VSQEAAPYPEPKETEITAFFAAAAALLALFSALLSMMWFNRIL